MEIIKAEKYSVLCEVRRGEDVNADYYSPDRLSIDFSTEKECENNIKTIYRIKIKNDGTSAFSGIMHFKLRTQIKDGKFFMPGYMYNRNTADMPSSGRKAFPRLKKGAASMPESEYFMTRSDRLAEPVSIIYGNGEVFGISAFPYIDDCKGGEGLFNGFTCNINDEGFESVGFTLGYENAPWLFVQTATVVERKPVTDANSFSLMAGEEYSFSLTVYNYAGSDERAIYTAIEDVYYEYHEAPRTVEGMDVTRALSMLSGAIRDYAWLDEEKIYTGFVYDRPEGLAYNRIPSVSWTNGMAVATPMLMAANRLSDDRAREQSITFIDDIIKSSLNPESGFMYESVEDGKATVRGWWYNGMHSGGHSSYINGQAVYYILKAYRDEIIYRHADHTEWLEFAGKIVERMNEVMNTDYEYPFSMSERTGAGIEYDSMGSAWFLAASAMYELITGDKKYMEMLVKSEAHYYETFVKKAECYGGPLDTDKAVDSEGILSYIRAVRLLHENTKEDYLLDHMKDALLYEFTFKLGYNTKIKVRPLSTIGWSSCGGSITSTANPHIHPMSSTIADEMKYYLTNREDRYIRSRMEDTIGWGLQTFNLYDGQYGYGKPGWMSERFCFCEGLLTEKYPNGEPASTWFALMPWASASIIEGLV